MSQWRERLRRIYRLCKARDRRSPNKRQRNLLLETFGRRESPFTRVFARISGDVIFFRQRFFCWRLEVWGFSGVRG